MNSPINPDSSALKSIDVIPHFIHYTPSIPPSSLFYGDLCNARNQGRAAMEDLAMLFIDGSQSYKGQFLVLSELASTHADFLLNATNILKHLRESDVQQLCESLELLLVNSNCKTLADVLNDSSYCEFVDRVWQNYFSLIILLGYNQQLFDTLAQMLNTANVLDALYGKSDVAVPIVFKQVQDLLRASVILPDAIFPLPPA